MLAMFRKMLLTAAVVLLATQAAHATTTLDATARGWYRSDSVWSHSSQWNYLAGENFGRIGNNWLLFDLSSQASPVVAATLMLEVPDDVGFESTSDASETYTLFDVSPANVPLLLTGGDPSVFFDLGSGTSFGSIVATPAVNGTTVSIPLNAAGVAAINSSLGGDFAVGGAVTTLNPESDREFIFAFTDSSSTTQLVLVPELATATGQLLALGLLLAARRARAA